MWVVKRFLLVLATMGFLWNNWWSVSLYKMGPFSGWWRLGGNDQQYLAAPIWKYRPGIGDHRFTFFMDLHSSYTFYTNLTLLLIGYLLYRRCDTHDGVKSIKGWEKFATSFDAGLTIHLPILVLVCLLEVMPKLGFHIQSSAVITRSNLLRYYLWHCDDSRRT